MHTEMDDKRPYPMDRTILLTGATGYVGGLAAATIVADRSARVILLTRGKRDSHAVATRIAQEAARLTRTHDPHPLDRIVVGQMQDRFTAETVVQAVQRYRISEILHCAGCLSYWNTEKLQAGNVRLTEEMLKAGRQLGVARFVFLSSAFSSGYMQGVVREQLHTHPGPDPTPYTSSKREAEMRVAESGLPYLIVRPSIVIGDSKTGRYTGNLSGLYQFLWAIQRYLFDRRSVIHLVAPDIPLQVIHQDTFQTGFLAAYKHLGDNAIIHLVSPQKHLPTLRQLWDGLLAQYQPNCKREYYDHYREIPIAACDAPMRQFLLAVQTNAEICAHDWRFEAQAMGLLAGLGTQFAAASFDTVAMCQESFFSTHQPAGIGDPGQLQPAKTNSTVGVE